MQTTDYHAIKKALAPIAKPCAFLHLPALENNIQKIATQAGSKKIRIATKSIRSVKVLEKIMNASDVIQGLMCFTAEEALFLSEKGMDDLLIAYPVWDEKDLRDISLKVQSGEHITVMIDSPSHISHLEAVARKSGGSFLVCLDIDLSSHFPGLYFGTYRSPVRRRKDVIALAKKLKHSAFLEVDGVMGYEAQIAGVPDSDPAQKAKSMMVRKLKKRSQKEVASKRKKMVQAVEKVLGHSLRFVNGGGTGSLATTGKESTVTEMTVGSGFYNPHLFDKYVGFQYEAAAGFAVEITRIPKRNMFTCAGGGYTASGAAGKDRLPEVYMPEGATLTNQEGVGEVQTPIHYRGPISLTYGDPIILRHSKAGELCERFQELHIIENDMIVATVPTYRGEGKCFL